MLAVLVEGAIVLAVAFGLLVVVVVVVVLVVVVVVVVLRIGTDAASPSCPWARSIFSRENSKANINSLL